MNDTLLPVCGCAMTEKECEAFNQQSITHLRLWKKIFTEKRDVALRQCARSGYTIEQTEFWRGQYKMADECLQFLELSFKAL